MTRQELETLIASFDSTPADIERIERNPVSDVSQLWELLAGVENEAEAAALVRTNPRFAAELADARGAYDGMLAFTGRCDAITAASDPGPLIAALSPEERAQFISCTVAMPPDGNVADYANTYLQSVLTE